MTDYAKELKYAIEATHGVVGLWIESVPVTEVFQGEIAWQGDVEVFSVTGHPKAKRCFAWGVRRDNDKGWDVTAVLGIPPVVTPELAVKAAIVAHARNRTTKSNDN